MDAVRCRLDTGVMGLADIDCGGFLGPFGVRVTDRLRSVESSLCLLFALPFDDGGKAISSTARVAPFRCWLATFDSGLEFGVLLETRR